MSCNEENHTLVTCIGVYGYYKGADMENKRNQKPSDDYKLGLCDRKRSKGIDDAKQGSGDD